MDKQELLSTLKTLHNQLESVSSIDEQTRSMLATLTEDIHRLTQTDEHGAVEADNLPDQIQDLMLKFESEHPQITSALNQVSSALANLGI